MNLIENEKLAVLAKSGDEKAKEELANTFKPFIINLCKKTFLNGYEFEDIQNECYKSLFKALNKYNPEKQRFVAYAAISIKNSIANLIRTSNRRDKTDSKSILTLSDSLENTLAYDLEFVEDMLFKEVMSLKVREVIERLATEEKELIKYVYLKNRTLKEYSKQAEISYSKAVRVRNRTFEKLRVIFQHEVI